MNDKIEEILTLYDNNTEVLKDAITDAGGDPNQIMNSYVKAFLKNLARNLITIDARYTGVTSYGGDQ